MMDEKRPRWKDRLAEAASNKKYRVGLIAVGLGLVGLLLFSKTWEKPSAKTDAAQTLPAEETAASYAAQIEESLTEMLGRIQGAGDVKVMVTIEKGVEQVYATEEKSNRQVTEDKGGDAETRNQKNDDTETTYILVKDADGGQKAVAVTQIQPVVKGVVVVCEGGGNSTVARQITDAVTTALDISSTKVCVVHSK